VTFARCCVEHACPLAEDPEHDTLTCVVTGRAAGQWHVRDLATGAVLALCSRVEGAVAVAESAADFDAEAMLADMLDRNGDRDPVARAPLPATVPPSSWAYMTRS
jgi:hypothetical protein